MADNNRSATQTEQAPQNPATEGKKPSFSLEKLRKNCFKLFNVSGSTFDGATYKLKQNKEYSVEKVKQTIEEWLKKPIKGKKEEK